MKAAQGIFANWLFVAFASTCLAQAPAGPTSSDKRTPLDESLHFYQQFSGKTVLRSPNLPSLSEFNEPVPSSDTNGMRIVLENELLNKGIEMVPLGEMIATAVEPGWKNSATANYISTIKPQAAPSAAVHVSTDEKPAEESIPAGTIDFRGADINQFLDLYAMLRNRTILRSTQIRSPDFKLRTQTPFTKNDVIYLLEALLALNGIASVEDGSNFIQIVPINQVGDLKLHAPQRTPDDPLMDPTSIPDFRYSHSFVPGKGFQANGPGAVDELVSFYARLTDRTAVSTNNVGNGPLIFKAQTHLTKPELLYALETTLALNGLAIIEVDDKTIRAGYVHELKQAQTKSQ
jgi:hypothetical protein